MSQQDRVNEVLDQLAQEQGAVAMQSEGDVRPLGDAILAEELDAIENAPAAFNSWVCWTKSV